MPITIQGVDAVPWFYRPAGPVLERLEWRTEILPTYNGKEQRRGLRLSPRRWFEFEVMLTERERRTAEQRIAKSQAALWALPVWMDNQPLPSALGAGATTLSIDTTTRDFRVGSYVGFIIDGATYETSLISNVAAGSLTFGALAAAWPAGTTMVVPIRGARMSDQQALSRFTGDASYGNLRWECSEPNDYTAATESTYRSIPVLADAPNWLEEPEIEFARRIERVDAGFGLSFYEDETGGPEFRQTHTWTLDGRAAIDAYRKWLYARRGRLQHFWLPTFAQDFEVTADIGSADTTIDVRHSDYVANIAQDVGRRDIRIQTEAGATFMRRITNAIVVNATTERLTIDSALGSAVAATSIKAVSYMALVRLDADAVEIAWQRHDWAESKLALRSSRNDL